MSRDPLPLSEVHATGRCAPWHGMHGDSIRGNSRIVVLAIPYGIVDPGGRPAVWDVIMMEESLNGTPMRLEGHLVPGRTPLLNKISELQTEISQLQEAVVSHTAVDQAIGVVITLGGLHPEQGFQVLREVSQRTNTKLRQVSELIVDWVHGEQLPDEIRTALSKALARAR
ncbi:ANTAR domain-containing protein [Streptomyces sp900105245]|uniref:ANTAR domain-containing protein n=1 Tax=Streptomyces sp. 900105245 TaxID=3154379 RepID=UPI003317C4C4